MTVFRHWKGFAAALLCIAALVGLLVTSPSFQRCEHDRKDTRPYRALHEDGAVSAQRMARGRLHLACGRATIGENDAAMTGLAGIATALLALALWLSTQGLRRAVQDSRADVQDWLRTAERTAAAGEAAAHGDRAWLFNDGLVFGESDNTHVNGVFVGKAYLFSVRWKNGGRTPALRVSLHVEHRVVDAGDDCPVFETARLPDASLVLGHGNQATTAYRVLTQEEFAQLGEFKKKCFVFSRAEYHDVFRPDIRRYSESCFQVDLNGLALNDKGEMERRIGMLPTGPQNGCS